MSFPWWLRRIKPKQPPQAWVPSPQIAAQEAPVRRYLDNADYILPKDFDEENRLNFQHHALHLTLGNHYLAPLPPTLRVVVDVGTGTGIWSAELARQYPESLVLGLDIDTALFSRTTPDNCLLRAGNILSGLPLPDRISDFTHQRFLVLAIPDARWPDVVHELVRVTRLGGWIELVETDARVQAGGPATEQMFAWIERVRQARGLMGEPVLHLGDLLKQEGVGEIESQAIQLRVGAWGGRAGSMMERDILTAIQALKAPCCAQGIGAPEFDACLQAVSVEWQQGQPFCNVYVAYGRRNNG